jgi:hypothetical protein
MRAQAVIEEQFLTVLHIGVLIKNVVALVELPGNTLAYFSDHA